MKKNEKKEIVALPAQDIDEMVTRHALAFHQLAKRRAQMEKKLAEVREEFGADIAPLENTVAELAEKLCVWIDGNRVLLGDRKSMAFTNGRIGIYENPPKVAVQPEIGTDGVLKALLKMDGGEQFIRMAKPALNKDAIKDAWAQCAEQFERIGLVLKSDETFFVQPKEEAPATA